MSGIDFSFTIGKTVSILITGKDDKTENYMGIIEKIDSGFIFLNPNNPNFSIERIVFRSDLVKSVWVYRTNGGNNSPDNPFKETIERINK